MNRDPGTDPLSPKKTKSVPPLQHSKMSSQSNKSSLRQFLSERILTSSKAAHLTSTFSVVISRRSQGWMRTDRCHRWTIERHTGITYIAVALLVAFHKLLFQLQAFHWACMKNFVFIHWPSLYKAGLWTVIFVPFGLETRFIKVLHYQPAARGFPSQGNPARPISLICILAKVMEGFARTRLVSQLSDKLDPRQYAREGHSTSDTLIYLLQEIHEATDREHCGARIFFAHYSRLITVYSKWIGKVWYRSCTNQLDQGVSYQPIASG